MFPFKVVDLFSSPEVNEESICAEPSAAVPATRFLIASLRDCWFGMRAIVGLEIYEMFPHVSLKYETFTLKFDKG